MKVTHYDIPAGITLNAAVCADFHSGIRRTRIVPTLLEQLRGLAPDLILFPGDTLNNTVQFGLNECFNVPGTELLKGCAAIAPVFLSVGNHEFGFTPENRKALENAGVRVLDNESAEWRGIRIGGFSSAYKKNKFEYDEPPVPDTDVSDLFPDDGKFRLLLCHHPEYWARYVVGHGIGLTVSGHAHGGQWSFFGRGVYAPGQGLFPAYVSGLHTAESGEMLAVSRGMSNTVKVPRFFNPKEILMLHLHEFIK